MNRCKGVMEKPVQKSHSFDIDGGSTSGSSKFKKMRNLEVSRYPKFDYIDS